MVQLERVGPRPPLHLAVGNGFFGLTRSRARFTGLGSRSTKNAKLANWVMEEILRPDNQCGTSFSATGEVQSGRVRWGNNQDLELIAYLCFN